MIHKILEMLLYRKWNMTDWKMLGRSIDRYVAGCWKRCATFIGVNVARDESSEIPYLQGITLKLN